MLRMRGSPNSRSPSQLLLRYDDADVRWRETHRTSSKIRTRRTTHRVTVPGRCCGALAVLRMIGDHASSVHVPLTGRWCHAFFTRPGNVIARGVPPPARPSPVGTRAPRRLGEWSRSAPLARRS